MSIRCDVLILGAGAAGLFCAIEAAKRGRKVIVLERSSSAGKKIIISGGGRCNFTNRSVGIENYSSNNPQFCRSALQRYTPKDFIELVEHYGIEYYEKKDGQLFCTDSSKQILQLLLTECKRYNIEIVLNCKIESFRRTEDGFEVQALSEQWLSTSLVVATGGASIPKMGATTFGYEVAKAFGLNVIEPKPALVPLLWNENDKHIFSAIAGVSFTAKVSFGKWSFYDDILFTHLGVSGPAILQLSTYWNEGEPISIDLLASDTEGVFPALQQPRPHKTLAAVLSLVLPRRFADLWAGAYHHTDTLDRYTNKAYALLLEELRYWNIYPETTQGFDKAEVTAGGVDTKELSSKTMEATAVKGLYFIGEVVDVTGWLGGYNFQWAWSSGWAAGQVV